MKSYIHARRRAVGRRYMLLLMFAFNLPGSHLMTNAGLAGLQINKVEKENFNSIVLAQFVS